MLEASEILNKMRPFRTPGFEGQLRITPWIERRYTAHRRITHGISVYKEIAHVIGNEYTINYELRNAEKWYFGIVTTEPGTREDCDALLQRFVAHQITNGAIVPLPPEQYALPSTITEAAYKRQPLTITSIDPKHLASMLFWHPTGTVVRLTESHATCETAAGTLLLAPPQLTPAHKRYHAAELAPWQTLAEAYDMFLPPWQKTAPTVPISNAPLFTKILSNSC